MEMAPPPCFAWSPSPWSCAPQGGRKGPDELECRYSLDQQQARELRREAGGKGGQAVVGPIEILRRIGAREVAPALVGAAGERADGHQLRGEVDDRPAVLLALREAENNLAGGEAVLDDPVDRAADQLVGALGAEAGDERHDAVRGA